jgi:hypothetical protein
VDGQPLLCGTHLTDRIVDLASLSTQQLSQVKKQLDDEVQHLTNSYQNLRTAQQKFRDCIASIKNGVANSVKGERLHYPLSAPQTRLTNIQTNPYSFH